MKTKITQTCKLATAVALAAFAFTGCVTSPANDPTTDGANAVISQESNNMGATLNITPAAKTATDVGGAGELVIDPLHYDSTCGCFVRTAQYTGVLGFERLRVDTIVLDSGSAVLTAFHPWHATSIHHIRHVTRINANTGREVDLTFNTTLTRDSAGFVRNGTITGTFNGVDASHTLTCTIVNVMHPVTLVGGLYIVGFPTSGTITIQRGIYTVVIDFTGSVTGSATATCTVSKSGVQIRVTNVDLVTGTET